MKKKLIMSYLFVIIFSILITSFASIKIIESFYSKSVEDKLISNSKILYDLFVNQYKDDNQNYDLFVKQYAQTINARITIILKDGKVIADTDVPSISMENHIEREEIQDALLGKIGIIYRYSKTIKTDMLYVAIPFNYKDIENKFIIRLSVPLTDIKQMYKSFIKYIILAVILGLTVPLILVYKFINKVTSRIEGMAHISSQIANGQYEKRIISYGNDELGKLSNTFNNMAEKLEITINDLSDQKNKLEAILTSMENGIIAVDNEKKIILINPAAQKMFFLNENIYGKHIIEVFKNMEFENIINNNINEYKEIKLNYPEKKILRVKATPIRNFNNTGIVIVIQDITELKHLELMRSEFVANVSHELKTPLTSIKGFAETLKSGAINDDKTKDKFLDIINVEADRLTRLINDILSLSELENKKQNIIFEKINLNYAISEIDYMMNSLASLKNIKLEFKLKNDLPYIVGNHDKIKQLLINLIDNAIKYTPQYGNVYVRTYTENKKVILEVQDTGIGISKEHIPRLFERFYRVDKGRSRALGGTGLGLAIVKHIVVLMEGEIKVESENGKGSLFRIIIPSTN